MRTTRTSQVSLFLGMVFIILVACNLPSTTVQNRTPSDPANKQLSVPTQTIFLEPTPTSRCNLYLGESLSLFVLGIKPGDGSVLTYTEFSNKVIGVEDQRDDGLPWEYSATLGESASVWCKLFEGAAFSGRLYCLFPLPKEYRNTTQVFNLYVNHCKTPIYSVANQSLMVEKAPPVSCCFRWWIQ